MDFDYNSKKNYQIYQPHQKNYQNYHPHPRPNQQFANKKTSKYNNKFQKKPFEKPAIFNPALYISTSMVEDPWRLFRPIKN